MSGGRPSAARISQDAAKPRQDVTQFLDAALARKRRDQNSDGR